MKTKKGIGGRQQAWAAAVIAWAVALAAALAAYRTYKTALEKKKGEK